MNRTYHFSTTCLCGTAYQPIISRSSEASAHEFRATDILSQSVYLCHCTKCRKSSGLLFTSYFACGTPSLGGCDFLEVYDVGGGEMRYFCKRCGCHVFKSLSIVRPGGRRGRAPSIVGRAERGEEDTQWFAATGTLDLVKRPDLLHFVGHENVSDTIDGGGAVWLKEVEGSEMKMFEGVATDYYSGVTSAHYSIPENPIHSVTPTRSLPPVTASSSKVGDQEALKASCHCGAVKFHITRPDASSGLPESNFPDLMLAYHTQDANIKNPNNEKWWLRGEKYLAGTCACRSCRLASGFEVQAWAFVPRSNIFFEMPVEKNLPLDFTNVILKDVLRSYESSEGVVREFCAKCGATVFWHDKWRPDLIDVSVGLLETEEGVRAGKWLEWWTERVSFEEDAVAHGRVLVEALQKGLAAWAG